MQPLPLLTQQAVRDLAWAVFAPNLIDDFRFHPHGDGINSCQILLTAQRRDWLQALDRQPAALLQAISQLRSTRLGIYFETLWQFFLQADPQFQLCAANLRVYRNKQTLGEFDMLFVDLADDTLVHLELATKYFLDTGHHPGPACNGINLSNWLGPNRRDRLDLKLQRLLTHQIRLSEQPESQQLLAQYPGSTLRRQIAIKGFLFYPSAANAHRNAHAYPLSPEHSCGTWWHWPNFITRTNEKTKWRILPRRQWLSPAQVMMEEGEEKIFSSLQLATLFESHFSRPPAQALMLCEMVESENGFVEIGRNMVTAAEWPESPKPG